jgi:hypothetical protein
MSKKQFSLWSQIPLKHLTDSVMCHVSANKMMIRVILNKKYKYLKLNKLKNYSFFFFFFFFFKKERKRNGLGYQSATPVTFRFTLIQRRAICNLGQPQ